MADPRAARMVATMVDVTDDPRAVRTAVEKAR